MRKERRDQAAQKPRRAPFDFAQGSLRYRRQMRRRRNRRYLLIAALLILGVGIGVAVVLLANWLSLLIR
jgi:hypothetical protein